jgi:WD40 repeat protein
VIALTPDGKLLATGHRDGTIRVYVLAPPPIAAKVEPNPDLRLSPGPKASFDAGKRDLLCVALSKDEKTLAAGFEDGTVVVWDVASGKQTVLQEHQLPVRSLAFTPDGETLLTGGGDFLKRDRGEGKIWDLASGKVRRNFPGAGGAIFAVAVSPDGQTMAVGGTTAVRICDYPAAMKKLLVPEEVRGDIFSLAFSPDGQTIAAAGSSGVVYLWDWEPRRHGDTVVMNGHRDKIDSICFHPAGRKLATGSRDGTVKVWNLDTGEPRTVYEAPRKVWVRSVAFSGDGDVLAVGTSDHRVMLCDPTGVQKPFSLRDSDKEFGGEVAFAPGGKLLVTRNMKGVVQLWELSK